MSLFSRFFGGKQPPAEGEAQGTSATEKPPPPSGGARPPEDPQKETDRDLSNVSPNPEKFPDSDPTIDTRFAHWPNRAPPAEISPPVRSYEVQLPPGALDPDPIDGGQTEASHPSSRPPVVELPPRHVLEVNTEERGPPPSQTAPAIVVQRVVSIEAGTREIAHSSIPPAPLGWGHGHARPRPPAPTAEQTHTYVLSAEPSPPSSLLTSPVPRKRGSGQTAASALANANLPPPRAPQHASPQMPPLEPFADTAEMTWDEREPSWDDSKPNLDEALTPLVPEAALMAPTPAVPQVSAPLPKMRAAAPTLLGTPDMNAPLPPRNAPTRQDLPPMRRAAATLVGTPDFAQEPKTQETAAPHASQTQHDRKVEEEEEEPAPITDRQSKLGNGDLWKDDTFDDVLADVDAGFGAILEKNKNASVPPPGSPVFDDARQLFVELAASHMRHVRDFMMDLAAGPATADWIPLCIPATDSLRAGARAFELGDLVSALDAFLEALKASDTGAPSVEGAPRERLISTYAALAQTMPDAFTIDNARTEREGIIVRCLFAQVEEVRKVQQDKLFSAGLMSLEALFSAKPRDIVDTTGISLEIATKVYERFLKYKKETEGAAVDAERTGEWKKLKERVKELAAVHDAFEVASKNSDTKKKKETRRTREHLVLDVKILLARLGQPEALERVERMPFAEKISLVQKLIEKREQERVT